VVEIAHQNDEKLSYTNNRRVVKSILNLSKCSVDSQFFLSKILLSGISGQKKRILRHQFLVLAQIFISKCLKNKKITETSQSLNFE